MTLGSRRITISVEEMKDVSVWVTELRERGREEGTEGLGEFVGIVCFAGMRVFVVGNLFMKLSTFLRFLRRLPEDGEWDAEHLDDLLESSGIHVGVLGVAS
jgi:hypothetical protein